MGHKYSSRYGAGPNSICYSDDLLIDVLPTNSGPSMTVENVPRLSQHSNGYPILPEIDLEAIPLRVARELLKEFFVVAWSE
jgi:hypothetical protein